MMLKAMLEPKMSRCRWLWLQQRRSVPVGVVASLQQVFRRVAEHALRLEAPNMAHVARNLK